jgi:hypothetical protein
MVIVGLPLVGHDAINCWNGQTIGGFCRGHHRYALVKALLAGIMNYWGREANKRFYLP